MSDADEEVEPTDPDVAAYYLRREKRQRMIGLLSLPVVVALCVLGAIWGTNLISLKAAIPFMVLGVVAIAGGVVNILYVRRHPLE